MKFKLKKYKEQIMKIKTIKLNIIMEITLIKIHYLFKTKLTSILTINTLSKLSILLGLVSKQNKKFQIYH